MLFTFFNFFSKMLKKSNLGEENMNEDIKQAIEQAIYMIETGTYEVFENQKYSSVYMFATENVCGVVNCLNVSNKDILTASASGDHIFNMLLIGAKNIAAYDINIYAKYFYYFKEAAIKVLNYNEFLEFFFLKLFSFKSKVFDNKIFFNRILPNIKDESSKVFWNTLFKRYSGFELYTSSLFFTNCYSKNTYIKCNDYLKNEDNYKDLQKKLLTFEYEFYWVDIFNDLSNIPDKKYDIIYLSNILDRLREKDKISNVRRIKEIIEKLKKYLVPNGILSVCYLYCYLDDYWVSKTPYQINNPDIRYEHFNTGEYLYKHFNGINDIKGRVPKNMDAIMLMRKKTK